MKELEALKNIRRLLIKEYQYLADVIEKALTPPTQEEVCKALSEWLKVPVIFHETSMTFGISKATKIFPNAIKTICNYVSKFGVWYNDDNRVPTNVSIIVGRFYQGVKE